MTQWRRLVTDEIYTIKCIQCNRSALFDGVELMKVESRPGLEKWVCATGCRRKTKKTKDRKNRVRNEHLWTNPLLEHLSSQISLNTVSFEYGGDPIKGLSPSRYAYDIMLPLAHAQNEEPFGWVLFWAKYLSAEWAIIRLHTHVVKELPDHARVAHLGRLVTLCYCTGARVSERKLRKVLDIGRGPHLKYHQANEWVLGNLYAIEENYARLVRRHL